MMRRMARGALKLILNGVLLGDDGCDDVGSNDDCDDGDDDNKRGIGEGGFMARNAVTPPAVTERCQQCSILDMIVPHGFSSGG